MKQRHYVKSCPFCDVDALRAERGFVTETDDWVAFKPKTPPGHVPAASPLHTLLVPLHHVPRLWMLPPSFAVAMPYFIRATLLALGLNKRAPHNIGVNQGAAAGQTVEHLHLHLIPREEGDVFDPVGGIITPLAERLWEKVLPDDLPSIEEARREETRRAAHRREETRRAHRAGPWRQW